MAIFGQSDLPCNINDDALDLMKYAKGLADFLSECETPMTVAIQGEWGSGKTSLMKMVMRSLKDKDEIYYHSFETWQYGAIGEDVALGIHLLESLTDFIKNERSEDKSLSQKCKNVKNYFIPLFAVVMQSTVAAVASKTGVLDGQVMAQGLANLKSEDRLDLRKLKQEFSSMVQSLVGKGRLVVFIDDLDRVQPARAVGMLEILKNFMDVPKCVFVVACDYDVIRQGVRAKFGINDEEKVGAFFHKIFQLPFNMPIHAYAIEKMLSDFFYARLKVGQGEKKRKLSRELAIQVAPLIKKSCGTNPRSLKRFLNSLDLLACVRRQDKGDFLGIDERSNMALISLAVMQETWPKVCHYLVTCDEEQMVLALSTMRDGLDTEDDNEDGELTTILQDLYDESSSGKKWRVDPKVKRLCEFVGLMFNLLQVDDQGLCAKDVKAIQKWGQELSLTGMTADNCGSYRSEFRKNLKDKSGNSLTLTIMSIIDLIDSKVKKLPTASTTWNSDVVAFSVKSPNESCRILTISSKAECKLNIGRDADQIYYDAGVRFRDATKMHGANWKDHGKKSASFDLKCLNFSSDGVDIDTLRAAFSELVIAADRCASQTAKDLLVAETTAIDSATSSGPTTVSEPTTAFVSPPTAL